MTVVELSDSDDIVKRNIECIRIFSRTETSNSPGSAFRLCVFDDHFLFTSRKEPLPFSEKEEGEDGDESPSW